MGKGHLWWYINSQLFGFMGYHSVMVSYRPSISYSYITSIHHVLLHGSWDIHGIYPGSLKWFEDKEQRGWWLDTDGIWNIFTAVL